MTNDSTMGTGKTKFDLVIITQASARVLLEYYGYLINKLVSNTSSSCCKHTDTCTCL